MAAHAPPDQASGVRSTFKSSTPFAGCPPRRVQSAFVAMAALPGTTTLWLFVRKIAWYATATVLQSVQLVDVARAMFVLPLICPPKGAT
jgi:hypothetical protein